MTLTKAETIQLSVQQRRKRYYHKETAGGEESCCHFTLTLR